MNENIKALLQWGIVLGILIGFVYIVGEITGYNPAPSETMKQEVTQQTHRTIMRDQSLRNVPIRQNPDIYTYDDRGNSIKLIWNVEQDKYIQEYK